MLNIYQGFLCYPVFQEFSMDSFFVHLLSILRQQIYQCIFHCDFGKRCWQTVQYLEVWTVGIRRDPCSPSCCLSTRCLRRWAWMGGVLMRFLILSKWWSKQVLISGWQTIHKQGHILSSMSIRASKWYLTVPWSLYMGMVITLSDRSILLAHLMTSRSWLPLICSVWQIIFTGHSLGSKLNGCKRSWWKQQLRYGGFVVLIQEKFSQESKRG